MFKKVWNSLFTLLLVVTLTESAFAQRTVMQGIYNGTIIKNVKVDTDGSIIISGTITGGNAAASATGSAVPADAGYNGLNVGGTLRGQTGTNTSGSVYAGDVNVVGAPPITYNSTQPTKTNGQTVSDFQITSRGALIVNPGVEAFSVQPAPLIGGGSLASGAVTSAMTGTTSTSVIGATASNYIYITECTTSNSSTTVSTDIILQDGSGGTTLWTLPAPAATVATTGGGGGHFAFSVPLKVPTAGNALFAANVTTGSSTKISCGGFKSTVSY